MKLFDSKFASRIADKVTLTVGSWTFVVTQSIFLLMWIAMNVTSFVHHWDPYPFILLNLLLSFQAAYTAPIIMISQNKQAEKDRKDARLDLMISQKIEKDIGSIVHRLEEHETVLRELVLMLTEEKNNKK